MKKVVLFLFLFCFILLSVSIAVTANDERLINSTEEIIAEIKKDKKVLASNNEKSLNSIIIGNEDGTNTMYVFNQDIKYIDSTGNVIDKELSLTTSSDKQRLKDGYMLTVKSNDIESSFPISLNNRGIIIENIEFVPKDSMATLNGTSFDVAEYLNVFDGIDLICKPEYQGVSAIIEADRVDAFNNVKFCVNDELAGKIYSENGDIIVEDDENTYVITSSTIKNSKDEDIGISTLSLDENNEIVMDYELESVDSTNDGVYTSIKIIIYKNYIQNVTIYEDTIPTSDGYNYIGTKDGYGAARTLIKFNLSSLDGINYDDILSAYYCTSAEEVVNSCMADVYMVTSSWNTTLDNIDYMPSIDYSSKIFSINMHRGMVDSTAKEIYITSAVQAWLQGYDNNGIMIKARNDEGWAKFNAPTYDEIDNSMPYLKVTYSSNSNTPITKGVERGEYYYLINKKNKSSIKVLDIVPPTTTELTDFSMSNMEGWHIIYDSSVDGIEYFRLRSCNSTGMLEASEPDSQGISYVNLAITNSSDGQKWQIKRNWNGSYKIIPKNSNGTKALSILSSDTGELYLGLAECTVDSNECDDWTLLPYSKGDATLYGTCDSCSNLDSQDEINNVTALFEKNGYDCTNYHSCNIESNTGSDEEMAYKYLKKLFDSQIWYFSHHGLCSRMQFTEPNSELSESRIGVTNTVEYDEDNYSDVNVYGVADYDGDLNKLQFAFINSCEAGANYDNENLIGTMYQEGAHFVMAHTIPVSDGTWESWQKSFNIAFQACDVESAMIFADRFNENSNSITSVVPKHILGDDSIFYNYEANAIGLESNEVECLLVNDNANFDDLSGLSSLPSLIADTSEVDYNELYYEYDSNGNIHGYSKLIKETTDNEVQLLYHYNDRYNELGNNYIDNVTKAMIFAKDYIKSEMNIEVNTDYVVSYTTNSYTNEFVYKCTNSDATYNEIKNIIVYVEEDDENNQHVTFYQALYGE